MSDLNKCSSTDVIIINKVGVLKKLTIKEFDVKTLYKKCGFKQPNGFEKRAEWKVTLSGVTHLVYLYAKVTGRATYENKYDFPPPVDLTLFFGGCALVGMRREITRQGSNKDCAQKTYTNVNTDLAVST